MSWYRVYGEIGNVPVSCEMDGNTGAQALKRTVSAFMEEKNIHFHGKNWKNKRDAWIAEHVRLNVVQIER